MIALWTLCLAQNFLIVVADDLSTEFVGVYGKGDPATQPPTPHMDALAANGVRFYNAYSHPVCSSTRASLLTGRLPFRTGIGAIIRAGEPDRVPLEQVTLFEALRGGGYTCAMVGKWHLGDSSVFLDPLLQGVDVFLGTRTQAKPDYWQYDQRLVFPWMDQPLPPTRYSPTELTDHVLQLQQVLPEPWCLVLTHHAPHAPFHVPPASLHHYGSPADDKTRYQAMVEALDTEVGRLLQGVDLTDTTVIFVGDNGTPRPVARDPLRAKTTMYQDGINVPLLVAGAGVPRHGMSRALVSVTDVYATVLELAGIKGGAPDSKSFADALQDPAFTGRKIVSAEFFFPNGHGHKTKWQRMAREDRFKLIRDEIRGTEQLFDLWTDPYEQSPLAPQGLSPQARDAYLALTDYLVQLPPP